MLPPARARLAAIAAGLALATGVITPAFASTGSDEPPAVDDTAIPAGESKTVTLITGDVVHVTTLPTGKDTVTVDAVSGAPDTIQTVQIDDDVYVLPEAASKYLSSGALDRQLFNVSDLIEYGYDDASSSGIPVIAQYDMRARAARTAPTGSEQTLALGSIDGAALQTDSEQSTAFWSALTAPATARAGGSGELAGGAITKLWLDGQVSSTLEVSVPLVGAPEAWAAGHDGSGARVAVLDTGIDAEHPDVADVVTEAVSFVPGEEVTDVNGHGTHVAATVAGSGAASNGTHTGVAPGAEVVVGKVLSDAGTGQDSWIIAGMEWAVTDGGADIVSMSLGDDERNDQDNPMAQAVNELSERHDALFVIAAGNSGAKGTIGTPGTAEAALTIAATDDDDDLAPFSSRGPRGLDDGLKPDMAAPGVGITAARSQYSSGSGLFKTLSGTSMATPHVAGAAAILVGAHPDWSASRLKSALMSSAVELDYTAYEVGTGRLDIPAALDGVDATGSVYFGKVAWGDTDPEPVTKTITYSNDTDTALELTLTTTSSGPDGAIDLVELSAETLTVPAHGTATVDATASFGSAPTAGNHLGQVVATAADGSVAARTTTGLTREDERYDLDITVLGPDGKPARADVLTFQYGTTSFVERSTDPATGAVATQRVAPGTFAVMTKLRFGSGAGTDNTYWLTAPHLTVADGDAHIVLDASKAVPVELKTPKKSAPYTSRVEWFHDAGLGDEPTTFLSSLNVAPGSRMWMLPTGDVAGGEYDFTMRWSKTEPLLDLAVKSGSDKTAVAGLYQRGSARLDGRVDLAVVDAGDGTPDEIAAADAEGAALLVADDPTLTAAGRAARAAAAAEAGAELLILANSQAGALYDAAGGSVVPTISVSTDTGAALAAAAETGARLTGSATRYPDYTYDYVHTWKGSAPENLTLSPRERDLVKITDRFVDPQPKLMYIHRFDCPAYLLRCFGSSQDWMTGSDHVVYVSPAQKDAGSTWVAAVETVAPSWYLTTDEESYKPGERETLDWFEITAPRQGGGFTESYSRGLQLRANVPSGSASEQLSGYYPSGAKLASRLYKGDTLLRSSSSQSVAANAPAATGPQTYRYELDVTAPAGTVNSTRTATAWTFVDDQAEDGDLPIIGLSYDAPADLSGEVLRASLVTITPSHVEGARNTGEFTSLTAEVSFDEGATWKKAHAVRVGDSWTVPFLAPKGSSSVSLRTTVNDDAGNAVTQEIIRAVGVR